MNNEALRNYKERVQKILNAFDLDELEAYVSDHSFQYEYKFYTSNNGFYGNPELVSILLQKTEKEFGKKGNIYTKSKEFKERLKNMNFFDDDPDLKNEVLKYVIDLQVLYLKTELVHKLRDIKYVYTAKELVTLRNEINNFLEQFKYFDKLNLPTYDESEYSFFADILFDSDDNMINLPKDSDIDKLQKLSESIDKFLEKHERKSSEIFERDYLPKFLKEYNDLRIQFPKDTLKQKFISEAENILNQKNSTVASFLAYKILFDGEKANLIEGGKKKNSNKKSKRTSRRKSKRSSKKKKISK